MDLRGTAAGGEEIMMQEVVDQINKCVDYKATHISEWEDDNSSFWYE